MYTSILATNLDKFDYFHSQLSMNGKATIQFCPGFDMQNKFLLLLSHERALKCVCWINLQRRKRTECVKLPIGTLV